MTDDLRARHVETAISRLLANTGLDLDDPDRTFCKSCGLPWPCDTARETARADKAEAALEVVRHDYNVSEGGRFMTGYVLRSERDAARALADELAKRLDEWHQAHDIHSGGVCPFDCPTADALARWEASRE